MAQPRVTAAGAGLLLVIAGFCLPMMLGLREPELRSDEAIYSYGVERILDTGHWLTPRNIPDDGPFLEKPPLNMWIAAAAIKLGLPRDELGLRFFDGVFGALGFLYVYLIGQRLAGPGGGLVAALMLFTMHLLAFDHGLRSNNMEAAVFLSYCGGIFHFARWAEAGPAGRARGDAVAVAAYFVLGFMTKFVAALFLPFVCALALAWRPDHDGWALVRARLREWWLPLALVLVGCVPWFAYETWLFGAFFWRVIFGAHVFQRFTSSLDPTHVHPWYFYITTTWHELTHADSAIIAVAGGARLLYVALHDRSWVARLVVLWGVVPMALISIGTSKLPHYAYPFWPPIGLGAGMAYMWAVGQLDARVGKWIVETLATRVPARWMSWSLREGGARQVALVAIVGLIALAVVTFIHGPLRFEYHGTVWFKNGSVVRPIFFAAILAGLAGHARNLVRLLGAVLLMLFLPLGAYANEFENIGAIDHPIRTTRDCIADVHASGVPAGTSILAASGDVFHHGYYFYLWRLGPWIGLEKFDQALALEHLTAPGEQTPVLIARPDYDALVASLPPAPADASTEDDTTRELRATLKNGGLRYDQNIAILLPGPYRGCAQRILKDGGWPLWDKPAGK